MRLEDGCGDDWERRIIRRCQDSRTNVPIEEEENSLHVILKKEPQFI